MKQILAGQTIGEVDDMTLAEILSTQLLHEHFIANPSAVTPISDRDRVKLVERTNGRLAPHPKIRQE